MSSTASTSSRDGSGSGTTLSKDALYAPLSTFAEFTSSTTTLLTTQQKQQQQQQQQQQHSLALQTSSSLRESSLLTFVSSSICANLKTCHSQECNLYRDGLLGDGAFAKYGMGDGNHDGVSYSNSIRSLLESKLSNRSLVLVGGGVHTTTTTSSSSTHTLTARGINGAGGGGKQQLIERGDRGGIGGLGTTTTTTTTMTATVTSSSLGGSSSKRVRKRVGGNGIFGCISNKRRKKILNQCVGTRGKKKEEEDSNILGRQVMKKKNPDGKGGVNVHNPEKEKEGEEPLPIISTSHQQQQQQPLQQQQAELQVSKELIHPQSSPKNNDVHRQLLSENDEMISSNIHERTGSVIEELCKMWIDYIHQQLCHSSFRDDHDPLSHSSITTATKNTATFIATTSPPPPLSSSLDQRKRQLSHMLATCEHVGMAVTIIQCPSRRHLLYQRGIVVQETKETWSMAMLVVPNKRTKNRKKERDDDRGSKQNEESESESKSNGAVAPSPPPPPPSVSSEKSTSTEWKIVMVPKRGTVLEVSFPWKNDQEEYVVTVHLET